jgi:hypothetical protein
MAGLTFVLAIGLLYYQDLHNWSVNFFNNNTFITDFSFLVTIFLIPTIYLLGHLIASIDFLILKYFIWIYNRLKESKRFRWWLKLNEILFYRHRIIYRVVRHCKLQEKERKLLSTEDFWILCARLQKEKLYDYAGYWYILNDLFKTLLIVFAIGIVMAIYNQCWELFIVFSILTLFCYFRAGQFAKFFVDTIIRQARLLAE